MRNETVHKTRTLCRFLTFFLCAASFVLILHVMCPAQNQRLAIAPRAEIIELPPGGKSAPIKSFCLDKDLTAPQNVTPFENLHTPGSIKFFVGNSKVPARFEDIIKPSNRLLRVDAHHLEITFTNISTTSKLAIQIPRATVFGRVAGLENTDVLQLVENYALTPVTLEDFVTRDYEVRQQMIWKQNATLSLLRLLGYWDPGLPHDQVTAEIIGRALQRAAEKHKTNDLLSALDREYRDIRSSDGSFLKQRERDLGQSRESAVNDMKLVLALKRTDKCSLSTYGVSIPAARVYGTARELRDILTASQPSLVPLEFSCRDAELTTPGDFIPPRGGGGGTTPPGRGPWIDFSDLSPTDLGTLLENATKKNDCSAEICLNTKGDRKMGFECNGYGFGVSTSKEVEVKIMGVTIPVKK